MLRLENITAGEVYERLSQWSLPEIPGPLRALTEKHKIERLSIEELGGALDQIVNRGEKASIEPVLVDWLYDMVRLNIKRGRLFQLRAILDQGYADCLGYAKLLDLIGKKLGLATGIIEVLIDNKGRYVPHYINLVKSTGGNRLFPDLWYGSKNIVHLRIGARVKQKGRWTIRDMDWSEAETKDDIAGLPQRCIDAITYYILGNRHLEAGLHLSDYKELDTAIKHYNQAARLYPQNARIHFNRAIAYENKGDKERALENYSRALKDASSQIRVLAREHEEITRLIELDEAPYLTWRT